MINSELETYARRLGRKRQDVKRLLAAAACSKEGARIARSVLRAKLRQAGLDPDDDDPFAPCVASGAPFAPGIDVGRIHGAGETVFLSQQELRLGVLATGCHGSGKTNFGYLLAERLANRP